MTPTWVQQVSDPEFLGGLDRLALARRPNTRDDDARAAGAPRSCGLDWVGHRAYQPGDDFRYLDWHLYRRFGRPHVRRFAAEPAHRLDLLIDRSRSMTLGTPPKADLAAALAFVFGYVALRAGGRVAATCFAADRATPLPAGRGPSHRGRLLEFLRRAPTGGRIDLADCVGSFASRAREVGQVVILSDLLDPAVEQALRALRHRGFEVKVIRLRSVCDEEPTLAAGSSVVVDAETGMRKRVAIGPETLAHYRAARRREAETTRRVCTEAGVGISLLGTWLPLRQIVFEHLPREGLLSARCGS